MSDAPEQKFSDVFRMLAAQSRFAADNIDKVASWLDNSTNEADGQSFEFNVSKDEYGLLKTIGEAGAVVLMFQALHADMKNIVPKVFPSVQPGKEGETVDGIGVKIIENVRKVIAESPISKQRAATIPAPPRQDVQKEEKPFTFNQNQKDKAKA